MYEIFKTKTGLFNYQIKVGNQLIVEGKTFTQKTNSIKGIRSLKQSIKENKTSIVAIGEVCFFRAFAGNGKEIATSNNFSRDQLKQCINELEKNISNYEIIDLTKG